VHPTCQQYSKPLGNKYLTVVEGQKSKVASQRFNDSAIQREQSEIDPFDHEIALAFVTEKGLVIVSCCSHHGALNTIASCMEFTGCNTLHAYIGGLHFVDSPEVEAETTSFIGDWLRLYPNAHLYTGHCTCPKAAALLKTHLPHCHTFYTGMMVEV
jgi:7,8-dihydropterin-6-yl-methyl-4-(beta-D-ribofuranosyl)aminobenzene 5'-phosphate synthase